MNTHFTRLCLAVFAAALILPALASAGVRPDDRAGTRGAGASTAQLSYPRPDDRAGLRGGSVLQVATPDAFERAVQIHQSDLQRAERGGPDAFERAVQIHLADLQRTSSGGGGVDWTTWAYLGGISALAAMLLALLAVHALRGRRDVAPA